MIYHSGDLPSLLVDELANIASSVPPSPNLALLKQYNCRSGPVAGESDKNSAATGKQTLARMGCFADIDNTCLLHTCRASYVVRQRGDRAMLTLAGKASFDLHESNAVRSAVLQRLLRLQPFVHRQRPLTSNVRRHSLQPAVCRHKRPHMCDLAKSIPTVTQIYVDFVSCPGLLNPTRTCFPDSDQHSRLEPGSARSARLPSRWARQLTFHTHTHRGSRTSICDIVAVITGI